MNNKTLIGNAMTSLLFRIYCLTTVSLLHGNSAIGLKHVTKSEDENSKQYFLNNSLVVLVDDPSVTEEKYQGDAIGLRNQDLSDEALKKFRPIIGDRPKTLSDLRQRWHVLRRQAEAEHQFQLEAIVKFMCDHVQSTIYLTYEAHRIAETGIVMDKLRKMTEDLDDPDLKDVKGTVILCSKSLAQPRQFIWSIPNHARIDVINDWPV